MGQEAAPEFEKEFGGRVSDDQLQAYVRAVGQKVAERCDRPLSYDFVVVASGTPNAFALPGGKVFITAGLVRLMENERQLAAVLGHEISHVVAKHNVKGMQRQMGAELLLSLAGRVMAKGNQAETAQAVAKIVAGVATMKYSRDDEYQADSLGIRYMTRAGYNPWGMVELLNSLASLSAREPGRLAEMFQTHPLTSKRIAEATAAIQNDPATRAFSAGAPDPGMATFQQMRRRLPTAPAAK